VRLLPYDATVVLGTGNYVLTVVTYITTEDLVFVALEQTDVFACLAVPNATNAIKTCAENKVVLGVEFDSSHLSLMAS